MRRKASAIPGFRPGTISRPAGPMCCRPFWGASPGTCLSTAGGSGRPSAGAAAAILAAAVGAGAILKPHLAENWVRPAKEQVEKLPEETEDNTFFQSEQLPEDFLAILENRETFLFTETNTEMTLSEYTEFLREALENRDCGPVSYGLADVDRDGERELIVRYHLLWEDCGLLILDRGEGKITGWAEKSDILPDTQWELLPEGYQSVSDRPWRVHGEAFMLESSVTAGWSTYIPNNGEWAMMTKSMRDREGDIIYTPDPETKFCVRDLGEKTPEECLQWAKDTYKDYAPYVGQDGDMTGRRQGQVLSVRFVQYRGGYFALVGTCPEGETETTGGSIRVMFQEFRVEMFPPTTLLGTWTLHGEVPKEIKTQAAVSYTFYGNMTGRAILPAGEARPFAYALFEDTLELRFFSGEVQRRPCRREEDKLVLTQDDQEITYDWQTQGN